MACEEGSKLNAMGYKKHGTRLISLKSQEENKQTPVDYLVQESHVLTCL